MTGLGAARKEINELRTDASDIEGEALEKYRRVEEIDTNWHGTHPGGRTQEAAGEHSGSGAEEDDMIAAARAKISEEEARQLILARFQRLLTEQFDGYLRQYQRAFISAVENLWQKYAVTTKQILAERDREAAQLNKFLKELGMSDTEFTNTRIRDLIREDRPICYGVLKPGDHVPTGVPLVRIVDITNNRLETKSLHRISSG